VRATQTDILSLPKYVYSPGSLDLSGDEKVSVLAQGLHKENNKQILSQNKFYKVKLRVISYAENNKSRSDIHNKTKSSKAY
jgi:hypothetical protein